MPIDIIQVDASALDITHNTSRIEELAHANLIGRILQNKSRSCEISGKLVVPASAHLVSTASEDLDLNAL